MKNKKNTFRCSDTLPPHPHTKCKHTKQVAKIYKYICTEPKGLKREAAKTWWDKEHSKMLLSLFCVDMGLGLKSSF